MENKLKNEAPFHPTPEYNHLTGKMIGFKDGISKRLAIAIAAMSLPIEMFDIQFEDEDMIEDVNGIYLKSEKGTYFYSEYRKKSQKTYSIKPESTLEKRFAKWLYKLADEIIKQEDK